MGNQENLQVVSNEVTLFKDATLWEIIIGVILFLGSLVGVTSSATRA